MLDYNLITEWLYVGTAFTPDEWYRLEAEGVQTCINLMAEKRDVFPHTPRPVAALWLPVPDWHPPTPDTLQIGVGFIQAAIAAQAKVYIHCLAGVGRSPTLAAAYLTTAGYSLNEALILIKRRRPVAGPNYIQLDALKTFTSGG